MEEGGVLTTKEDPKTGHEIPYAQERLFSVRSIGKLVQSYDFQVEELVTHGFLPCLPLSFRGKNLACYSHWLGRVPILGRFGANYAILALRR